MKRRRWVTGLAAAAMVLAGVASASDEQAYEACMLQYQKQVYTNYTAALVKQACENLYRGVGLLFSDDEAYYRCILENVPGIESDRAAENVRQICRRQSER